MRITRKDGIWTDGKVSSESFSDLLDHLKIGLGAVQDFSHFRAAADMYSNGYISRAGFTDMWRCSQNTAKEEGGAVCLK